MGYRGVWRSPVARLLWERLRQALAAQPTRKINDSIRRAGQLERGEAGAQERSRLNPNSAGAHLERMEPNLGAFSRREAARGAPHRAWALGRNADRLCGACQGRF